MADRETPGTAAGLYEARGTVPLALPLLQGDVFREVLIPSFKDEPVIAMITQHPCSMRAGAVLRARLTVATVRKRKTISERDWQGFGATMLLPDLLNDGDDYEADFSDIGVVPSSALSRSSRIAALTNYGVHVLQQRHVFYLTRFTIDVPTLAETFDPIATEMELQYEWVEAALDATPEVDALSVIEKAEQEFTSYLDENNRQRRQQLQETANRADVRRQVRREISKRYE